jgi:hypothetical protein
VRASAPKGRRRPGCGATVSGAWSCGAVPHVPCDPCPHDLMLSCTSTGTAIDLRPSGAAFAHEEILVPNIDKLASRGTTFTEAFVQAATCGVSRSSLLTSRRPDSTYVLNNGQCPFKTAPSHASWQSIPEYFRASGYTTGASRPVPPHATFPACLRRRRVDSLIPLCRVGVGMCTCVHV